MTWFSLEDQQSCSYHFFIWTYKIKATLNDYLFVVTTRLLQKRPRGLTWDAVNWISKGPSAAFTRQLPITNVILCFTESLFWWTEAIQCLLPLFCKKIYFFNPVCLSCVTAYFFVWDYFFSYCICTWLCIYPLLLLIVMLLMTAFMYMVLWFWGAKTATKGNYYSDSRAICSTVYCWLTSLAVAAVVYERRKILQSDRN